MRNKLSLKNTLYTLITLFVLIILFFVSSNFFDLNRKLFFLLAVLGFLFLIFGIILIFKAKKQTGRLKFFLILTGCSAIAPFIFSILHNVFYGMAIYFANFKLFFEILHVTSFLISIIIAPITFILGIIMSFILLKKK